MRRSRSLTWILSCSLAAAGVLPAPAPAQAEAADPSSRRLFLLARKHYERGVVLYDAGNYAAARAAFEEAYRLSRLPDLLFNLGRVCEKQGDAQAAADYLGRFLQARPDAPDAPQIRADIARLRGAGAPGLALLRRPLHEPLALFGAGAALVVLGAGLGGGALAAARGLEAADGKGAPFNQDLQALQARGQALSSAAIAFDVIGGLACAAGAAWTVAALVARRQARPPALAGFSPGLAPGGAGLLLSFSLRGDL
jgi:tetratricopeptide (TPR) repeat protein